MEQPHPTFLAVTTTDLAYDDAPERGGLPRSSEEGSVMGLERRRRVIAVDLGQPGCREEPFARRKAAAFMRWHEPDESRGSSPDL